MIKIPSMTTVARSCTVGDAAIFDFKDISRHRHLEYLLWLQADKTRKFRIITDIDLVSLKYDDTGEKIDYYVNEKTNATVVSCK